jgi:hypothetical protein
VVTGVGSGVGAERRELDHLPHLWHVRAGGEQRPRGGEVQALEALRARLAEDADRVDDRFYL